MKILSVLLACLLVCTTSGCAVLDTAHFAWCCGSVVKDVLDRAPVSATNKKKTVAPNRAPADKEKPSTL